MFKMSKNSSEIEGFFKYHENVQQDGSPGFGCVKIENSIAANCGPLLTHVSIMIAGLIAIFCSFTNTMSYCNKFIIVIEFLVYLVIAIGCLFCISEDITNDELILFRSLKENQNDYRLHIESINLKKRQETYKNFLFFRS